MLKAVSFQAATLLGAFLLFLVQPLMARQLLPWFGGAPSVWSASLVFFQVGLTAGYLYAHVVRRLTTPWQARLHLLLLLAALTTLPILVSPSWKPTGGEAPAWHVVLTLAATVGVPYALLGATAPLLQTWWRHVSGQEPYRLYALSNIGSLAALGAFPIIVEPALTTPGQTTLWSVLFACFVGLCGIVAGQVLRFSGARVLESPGSSGAELPVANPSPTQVSAWVVLSACGSALLVAITNQLCQDVAVVPLLWVLPLTMYLLTFVLTFAGIYPRRTSRTSFVVGILVSLGATAFAGSVPIAWQVGAFLLLLGGACMVCHGELVSLRPHADYLTSFYLALSAGGAIGGAFVALLAPRLFTSFFELPLLVLTVLMITLLRPASPRSLRPAILVFWILPAIALGVSARFLPGRTAAGETLVEARRDFFGVVRVQDHAQGSASPWRGLYHGRVLHGLQSQTPAARRVPTAYYSAVSGVAITFEQHPRRRAREPLRAAIVGLGTGTIAAWGRAGDELRFFELNPAIVDVAQRHFSFLEDSAASTSIVVGDARLALEREMAEPANRARYDVIVVDAFSGDSVPVHLLTRECFSLYLQALAPSGVLLFHVSNRHLELSVPVRGLATEAGLTSLELGAANASGFQGEWVFVTADREFASRAIKAGARVSPPAPSVVWSDHYSSLVSILR